MHNLQNSVTSATSVVHDEEKLGKYDNNHQHLSSSVCHFS